MQPPWFKVCLSYYQIPYAYNAAYLPIIGMLSGHKGRATSYPPGSHLLMQLATYVLLEYS